MSEINETNVNEAIDRIAAEVKETSERFDMLAKAQNQQHSCDCNHAQIPQQQFPALAKFVADLVEAEMESMNVLKSLSTKEMIDDTAADEYTKHLENVHNCFMVAVSALR